MHKLSLNNLDKYNKSCITFHLESKKIGFAFFWFLYDFVWNLQVSAKVKHYLRTHFAQRSLEVFDSLQKCPWFALRSSERLEVLQCGPRVRWPARPAQFRWGRQPWPGGSERRAAPGSPRLGFFARTGENEDRWRPTAAHDGAGRCGSEPGEGAAYPQQWVGVGAWVDVREGVGLLARRRRRAE
jgi:hypothetical protein